MATGAAPTRTLFDALDWFKSITTAYYIRGVRNYGWPRFPGTLWQRGYYEHIIRDDRSLEIIREYIAGNPAEWHRDVYRPS